ncbi:MAG: hypothetical protein JSW06_02685 [Thermoplasmatales archaeon]|nr:MAG: hypothetical protein JSW06_02685 [Thermoplasmatales archaeon]
MSNSVELELVGYEGSTVVTGTTGVNGSWRKIHVLADCNFALYTDSAMDGDITGNTIKQGTDLTGKITAFRLNSGSVIAYA